MADKYLPERMCVVCRKHFPKEKLLRVAVTSDGNLVVDKSGKSEGRGAYVCDNPECIAQCVKKRALNRAFKRQLPDEIYEALAEYEKQNS